MANNGWTDSLFLPGQKAIGKQYRGPSNSKRDHDAYEHYVKWCEDLGFGAADENTYHRATAAIQHGIIAEPPKR